MLENPTESFADFDHLLMATLRVWDPLGVFAGKYRAYARRMSLARRICQGFEVKRLARQLSEVSKRDFQRAAHVLAFLHRVSPRKFQAVAGEIDLDRINEAFGDEWQNMKHDAEVLLGVLFIAKSARDQVVKLIDRNSAKSSGFLHDWRLWRLKPRYGTSMAGEPSPWSVSIMLTGTLGLLSSPCSRNNARSPDDISAAL